LYFDASFRIFDLSPISERFNIIEQSFFRDSKSLRIISRSWLPRGVGSVTAIICVASSNDAITGQCEPAAVSIIM
jgi:hypothetical protein